MNSPLLGVRGQVPWACCCAQLPPTSVLFESTVLSSSTTWLRSAAREACMHAHSPPRSRSAVSDRMGKRGSLTPVISLPRRTCARASVSPTTARRQWMPHFLTRGFAPSQPFAQPVSIAAEGHACGAAEGSFLEQQSASTQLVLAARDAASGFNLIGRLAYQWHELPVACVSSTEARATRYRMP